MAAAKASRGEAVTPHLGCELLPNMASDRKIEARLSEMALPTRMQGVLGTALLGFQRIGCRKAAGLGQPQGSTYEEQEYHM